MRLPTRHCLRGPRIAIAAITLLAVSQAAPAQNLADLGDPIYDALSEWQALGYVSSLPYLRPYTPQRVVVALEEAAGERPAPAGAPVFVRRKAREWLSTVRDGIRPVEGRFFAETRFSRYGERENEYHGLFIPSVAAIWPIGDLVQFHGRFGEVFVDYTDGPALAYRRREMQEWIRDTSGKVEPFGRDMYQNHQLVSAMGVGTKEISFLTGMSRSSFGPIHDDGIFLSPEAPGSAQFVLTWDRPVLTGQLLYRPISASTFAGRGREPDKHLMFHSLQYRPLDWLELNFNEAVVWGGYLNLGYFVPANSFFLTQGLTGFDGNSFLGLSTLFKPIRGLAIPLTVNMDDMHWSDMMRGDWDTKYKFAFQGAVDWYPAAAGLPILTRVMVDYTAVMPYTYSHWDETPNPPAGEYNFSNYTHLGTNMATGLHPNSDRIRLQVRLRPPVAGLDFDLFVRSIRHGNASVGIIPEDPATGEGTGTIFDPGYIDSTATFQRPFEDPTGQPYTRFLTQDTLEKAMQIGGEVSWQLPFDLPFDIGFEVGYTFEAIDNAGLVAGERQVGHHVDVQLTAAY